MSKVVTEHDYTKEEIRSLLDSLKIEWKSKMNKSELWQLVPDTEGFSPGSAEPVNPWAEKHARVAKRNKERKKKEEEVINVNFISAEDRVLGKVLRKKLERLSPQEEGEESEL